MLNLLRKYGLFFGVAVVLIACCLAYWSHYHTGSHPGPVASQVEQAEQTAEAAKTPEQYLNLSLGYYRAGQYENSIDAAQKALKLKPDYDLAYNNICSAYNGLRMWDKAIEAGKRALELNPGNQLAKNNLAWAIMEKNKSN